MSAAAILALAGTAAVLAGGLLCVFRRLVSTGLVLQAVGIAGVGAAGLLVMLGTSAVGSAFSGGADLAFGIDRLSGYFLLVLAACAAPALVFGVGYLPGTRGVRTVGVLTAGFLLAMVGVLVARTPLVFLTFWELMTLLPAGAILVTRPEVEARRAVFQYLAITHLGGAGVWVSLLLIGGKGGFADPSVIGAGGTALQVVIVLAAVVGFGTKAGLMPFHTWLPRVHPLAPSHLSALMSGVMIKVALYGLIRVLFVWLGVTSAWVGILLLALGGLSALGGVVYALFQHDLKRLLAFHSIENIGIIVLGLGASLVFSSRGQPAWASLALAAALFHVAQPRLVQGAPLSGGGRHRPVGPRSGAGQAGRAATTHAVDRGRVLDRGHGYRRPAATQRLCLRVADPAIAGACGHRPRAGRGRPPPSPKAPVRARPWWARLPLPLWP